MKTLSISGHCARILLAAWNSADLTRLKSALDVAQEVKTESLSFAEQERVEMVHEVAGMIRQWLQRQRTTEDLTVSLELLRHLSQSLGT